MQTRKLGITAALVVSGALVAVIARNQMKDETRAGYSTSEPAAPVASPATQPPAEPPRALVPKPDTSASTPRPQTPVRNTVAEEAGAVQSPTGADVLRRAADAYARVKTLRAEFAQKRDNPILGSTTISHGMLYQKRPDRFLMKFSDPAGDVIVSDGRYFWLYYPSADARQVLRAPAASNAAGGVDLQAQFLGDPLRRFTHTYHGIETVNGRKTHVITMIPKENVGYKSLKVWVDAQDALVRRFVLTESNGVVQEITLSNLAVNPALSDDLFRFTPPPNAKIIENPS